MSKSLVDRHQDYMRQLALLRQWEKTYRLNGDEISLQTTRELIAKVRRDEKSLNRNDFEAYWLKVSGEPDYPHSLKTAFEDEFRQLWDDLDEA